MSQTSINHKAPEIYKDHPAWLRLEDQLNWYDKKSSRCQIFYKCMRFMQFSLAMLIPFIGLFDVVYARWITSFIGIFIAILEVIQHMNQYSTLWVSYRSMAEQLKHEKYLFLSAAGPFKDLTDADQLILLAERVEEHVSTEHAHWSDETRRTIMTQKKRGI